LLAFPSASSSYSFAFLAVLSYNCHFHSLPQFFLACLSLSGFSNFPFLCFRVFSSPFPTGLKQTSMSYSSGVLLGLLGLTWQRIHCLSQEKVLCVPMCLLFPPQPCRANDCQERLLPCGLVGTGFALSISDVLVVNTSICWSLVFCSMWCFPSCCYFCAAEGKHCQQFKRRHRGTITMRDK